MTNRSKSVVLFLLIAFSVLSLSAPTLVVIPLVPPKLSLRPFDGAPASGVRSQRASGESRIHDGSPPGRWQAESMLARPWTIRSLVERESWHRSPGSLSMARPRG